MDCLESQGASYMWLEHHSNAARQRVGEMRMQLGKACLCEVDGLASLTEINDRSKARCFLFPIKVQLEAWGAGPLLHTVTQGPGFFLLVVLPCDQN